MASVAATSPSVPRSLYERTMEGSTLEKERINNMVMDYFVTEGYIDAAVKFAEEANIQFEVDVTEMSQRKDIKDAIRRRDIQTAIEEINELSPQILDGDKALHFSILRLQLIELIKKTYTAAEADRPRVFGDAIKFAQENLAPYAPQNEKFKHDLERAMALMIVPKEAMQSAKARSENVGAFGPLYQLVDPDLRKEVADNVNSAIRRHRGMPDQSQIHTILQQRQWAENLARDRGNIDLPDDMTVSLEDPPSTTSGNGHGSSGDTEMTEGTDEGLVGDPVTRFTNIS